MRLKSYVCITVDKLISFQGYKGKGVVKGGHIFTKKRLSYSIIISCFEIPKETSSN